MTSQFKARCSQWTVVKTESEFKIKRTGFEDRERKGERRKVCFISSRSYVLYPFGTKHKLQICSFVVMARCGIKRPTDMNTLNAVLQNRTKPKSIPLKKL